jgi:hypothetical protein
MSSNTADSRSTHADLREHLVRHDPDRCWELTCLLVNKANSDEAIGFVAAGPLEDSLRKHGLAVIDRIEQASQQNVRLQTALSRVWIRPRILFLNVATEEPQYDHLVCEPRQLSSPKGIDLEGCTGDGLF